MMFDFSACCFKGHPCSINEHQVFILDFSHEVLSFDLVGLAGTVDQKFVGILNAHGREEGLPSRSLLHCIDLTATSPSLSMVMRTDPDVNSLISPC